MNEYNNKNEQSKIKIKMFVMLTYSQNFYLNL